jgi:hypothetical protein
MNNRRKLGGHSRNNNYSNNKNYARKTRFNSSDSNDDTVAPIGSKIYLRAVQCRENYLAKAKDCSVQGDKVAAENWLQHADHYARIIIAAKEHAQERQNQRPVHNHQTDLGGNADEKVTNSDDIAENNESLNEVSKEILQSEDIVAESPIIPPKKRINRVNKNNNANIEDKDINAE